MAIINLLEALVLVRLSFYNQDLSMDQEVGGLVVWIHGTEEHALALRRCQKPQVATLLRCWYDHCFFQQLTAQNEDQRQTANRLQFLGRLLVRDRSPALPSPRIGAKLAPPFCHGEILKFLSTYASFRPFVSQASNLPVLSHAFRIVRDIARSLNAP